MRIVVDTSLLIDHLGGRKEAEAVLLEAVENGSELWGSVLTRTEVLAEV